MLFDLFITFFKIGLFTFGGGYAMLKPIEDICVEQKSWISHKDMTHIVVIAESTPGPLAINCSTFVGYRQAGLSGAAAATLGVVAPSFIIIYLISLFFDNFPDNAIVQHALSGIKIAVAILIIDAAASMLKKSDRNVLSFIIVLLTVLILIAADFAAYKISFIILIIISGLAGVMFWTVFHMDRKMR